MSAPADEKLTEYGEAGKNDAASYTSHGAPLQASYAAEVDYRDVGLKRDLKARHLVFISIGACIGTGIFLGAGGALSKGGPLGLLLGYILISSVVICVMFQVCEMTTFLPVSGGHIRLAGRFVDPALSAIMGWNYIACWTLILAAELSASAVLISYWLPDVNPAAWIAPGSVIVLLFNVFGAGIYGEAEFWFSTIKVTLICGLIILSIIISAGGGPDHHSIGFRYWRNPGPFVQYDSIAGSKGRFLGFFAVLAQAAFAMIGTEMLALAAAESRNPRKVLPQCLKTVWIRIVAFYVLAVFCIGIIVSSNNSRLGSSSTAAASPFVIAIENAGISVLPHIINGGLITSALSAGCSDLYTSSRSLYSLAQKGHAPSIFARTTLNGVPHYAVAACWLIGCLAYLSCSRGSLTVFNFLVNLTALSGILTWFAIAITYLRFRAGMAKQGLPRSSLPWTSPFAHFGAYWTLLIVGIVVLFSGWEVFRPGHWDTADFFSNYLPLAWFAVGYVFFKLKWKTKIVSTSQMDFVSGVKDIEDDAVMWDAEDAEKKGTVKPGGIAEKILNLLCSS